LIEEKKNQEREFILGKKSNNRTDRMQIDVFIGDFIQKRLFLPFEWEI
jgi:hypothetical protein